MLMNPGLTNAFRQRLEMHRRRPRSSLGQSPAGGQQFGNNSPGGGFLYPWWYYYQYPYYGYAPYYGQRYFDGTYLWVWTGLSWVPYLVA